MAQRLKMASSKLREGLHLELEKGICEEIAPKSWLSVSSSICRTGVSVPPANRYSLRSLGILCLVGLAEVF